MGVKENFRVILVTSFLLVVLLTLGLLFVPNENTPSNDIQGINLEGVQVCVSTTGDFEGRKTSLGQYELVQCEHNVFYNMGKNLTRDILGGGSTGTPKIIALCNSTNGTHCGTPTAGASELFLYPASGDGLDNVSGTYSGIGNESNGLWYVTNTFTYSGTPAFKTNVTRLTNATANGWIFAGNSFTEVTLQTSDQITINWTLMVA